MPPLNRKLTHVFIHSRQNIGAKVVEEQFRQGKAQNPRPYGFEAAESDPELDVTFSESGNETALQRKLFGAFDIDVIHALRNLRRMRKADVIWTVLEWEWLAASLLQRLNLVPKVPIIGNSVWMMEHWRGWGRRRKWLYKWLMSRQVYLTLHSEEALRIAETEIPDRDFHLMPFGVSTLAFSPHPPKRWPTASRPIRLFSMGHDRTRDWPTLVGAFGNDPRFEIRVICRWIDDVVDTSLYNNLIVLKTEAISSQKECYEWADLVAITMTPNVFSGITVACEAAAQGLPVVCSETGGVPTYFSDGEILLIPPLDSTHLKEAVLQRSPEMWERQAFLAWERFNAGDYSAGGMSARYKRISEDLLSI